jgi:putative transposase
MPHQETWPMAVWCEVLDVSRRGFYADAHRQAAPYRDHEAAALLARVSAIHPETRQSDGSRRMAQPLQADGFPVGRDNARRLRQAAGVAVRHRQRCPVTTDRRHGSAVAPNLLARQFDVAPSNTVWAGDITDLWTAEGWFYWAAGLDLPSRKVVGWAMRSRIDAALVQEALRMALGRRGPAPGLRQPSDRGRQSACGADQELLAAHGIRCRMSCTGDGLDHAVVERFFGSLKGERTALGHYATRQEARDDVIDDIEMFYNSTRLHSSLGYVSPNDFERVANVA